ncbi:unnamed protein product [Polarella glacialis]|uniref:Uncharacterized protein n=1 Tax=Polarella glacialis TaxID=89957 RepID=A0A813I9J4_POLGL|nr:unnamed protein product [Polarella glacialis]
MQMNSLEAGAATCNGDTVGIMECQSPFNLGMTSLRDVVIHPLTAVSECPFLLQTSSLCPAPQVGFQSWWLGAADSDARPPLRPGFCHSHFLGEPEDNCVCPKVCFRRGSRRLSDLTISHRKLKRRTLDSRLARHVLGTEAER